MGFEVIELLVCELVLVFLLGPAYISGLCLNLKKPRQTEKGSPQQTNSSTPSRSPSAPFGKVLSATILHLSGRIWAKEAPFRFFAFAFGAEFWMLSIFVGDW